MCTLPQLRWTPTSLPPPHVPPQVHSRYLIPPPPYFHLHGSQFPTLLAHTPMMSLYRCTLGTNPLMGSQGSNTAARGTTSCMFAAEQQFMQWGLLIGEWL